MNEAIRRLRLAQTRANDAAHEAMMREAAKKAGERLDAIRGMSVRQGFAKRDAAFLRMFAKARGEA